MDSKTPEEIRAIFESLNREDDLGPALLEGHAVYWSKARVIAISSNVALAEGPNGQHVELRGSGGTFVDRFCIVYTPVKSQPPLTVDEEVAIPADHGEIETIWGRLDVFLAAENNIATAIGETIED